MNPMEHIVRLPQVLLRLQTSPEEKVCCFIQMEEDGTWAPILFRYCCETGKYGQLVSRDEWLWRTAEEMDAMFGEEYWLLMPE